MIYILNVYISSGVFTPFIYDMKSIYGIIPNFFIVNIKRKEKARVIVGVDLLIDRGKMSFFKEEDITLGGCFIKYGEGLEDKGVFIFIGGGFGFGVENIESNTFLGMGAGVWGEILLLLDSDKNTGVGAGVRYLPLRMSTYWLDISGIYSYLFFKIGR